MSARSTTSSSGSAAPVRSLAGALRAMSANSLTELLMQRPDVVAPIPTDISALAARLAARPSVRRAVDSLNAAQLQVLDVLALMSEPVMPEQVDDLWGGDAGLHLDHLAGLGLIWPISDVRADGGHPGFAVLQAVRDLIGPYPAGLGPRLQDTLARRSPSRIEGLAEDLGLGNFKTTAATAEAISAHLGDSAVVHRLLEPAPEGVRQVLQRLTWGPPIGQVPEADREVRVHSSGTAVEWLLARGLLAGADSGHVVLPREIALALREGRVHQERAEFAPIAKATPVLEKRRQQAAVGAISELLRYLHHLWEYWHSEPPAILRTGGLGLRDHRRTAQALDCPESTAALVIELAYMCGFLHDASDSEAAPHWVPGDGFDAWRALPAGEQWLAVATEWLNSNRLWQRILADDALRLLTNELSSNGTARTRRDILGVLALYTDALSPEDVLATLAWQHPRQSAAHRELHVSAVLHDAAILGMTGQGALSDPARMLLADDAPAALAWLDKQLPAPVDTIVIQADLTAMIPGTPTVDLATELSLLADVESRGAATVMRFSESSLRRGLDAGLDSNEILQRLRARSSTPIPQALEYLISDAARRYGAVRIGSARSYLRCDDPSAVTLLLSGHLGKTRQIQQLAPGVLIGICEPQELLQAAREAGIAAAVEGHDGQLIVGNRTPAARRISQARPGTVPPRARTTESGALRQQISALVAVLRQQEDHERRTGRSAENPAENRAEPSDLSRAGEQATAAAPPVSPSALMSLLRHAIAAKSALWVEIVDNTGTATRRLITPVSIDGGTLSAWDNASAQVRTWALHRVRKAVAADHTSADQPHA